MEVVGRDDISPEILDVSKWQIKQIVAEHCSTGNVFYLGDTVHRHPPFIGLGSNTCVQDAFNLAWKIKYVVVHNLASAALLDSYSKERQPVGLGVITRANQGIRDHAPVWKAMGLMEETVEKRMMAFNLLKEASKEGREHRRILNKAIEMNQRYASAAIYLGDEEKAGRAAPEWPVDAALHHEISTYPGHRLPHAWLNTRFPIKEPISTIDLAGHGAYCLLTGVGGGKWKLAAAKVGKEMGVDIRLYSIGWHQNCEDVYRDWEHKREVEEDGCVLAGSDRFVC